MRGLRPFAHVLRHAPAFAVLWLGQTLSLLGTGLVTGVFTFWFYDLTGSTLAVGTYSLLLLLARVALAPVAGLWADRTDRRRILLLTNLAMAGLALVPLLVRGPEQIALAYLGATLLSAAQALFSPAWQASLPNLVAPDDLPAANALNSIGTQLSFLIGPLTGGVLARLWGYGPAFVGNSISYLVAAATVLLAWRLWPVRGAQSATAPAAPSGPPAAPSGPAALPGGYDTSPSAGPRPEGWAPARALRDLGQALAFVRSHPILWSMLWAEIAFAAGTGAMNALFIPFMAEVLHSDAVGFGGVMVAQGLGGIAVAGYLGARARSSRHPGWVVAATAYLALSTLLYTAFPIYWLLAATVVLEGAFVEALFVVLNLWWQESTPDLLRGRAFALREMAGRIGQAASMVVGGWAAHLLGVRAVFFGIAGVLGMASLAAVAFAVRAQAAAHPGVTTQN